MADLAGTAAIRLVPSLTGFRQRAQTELQRQKGLAVDVDIRPRVDTSTASRQLERFRAKEQADAINLKAKIDEADFKRQFQRVEHVFERSAFAKAFRLQIKVVGADALYAVATAAASAAAALDTVAKSAVILPGALSAAGVAAGVFALALGDVKKAITSVQTEQDQAADKSRAFASAQRDSADAAKDVQRAHEQVSRSVKQAIRDYEDLAHAARGTSLNEADALLNIQESYDRLRQGGQKSLTELRRDQLSYLQDLHRMDEVRTQNKRTLEDYNEAQQKGIQGNEGVVSALDAVVAAQNRVADAAGRMADATQTKTMTGAYSRLAPAAKEFVDAITDAKGAWVELGAAMQQGVFEGQAKNLTDTINSLRTMRPELEGVAHQIGGVFLDAGEILRRGDIQTQIKGIVSSTGATIGTLRQGLDPLISGFIRMSDVGARHLPQLIDVFNRLFERFDAFTQKAADDGTLDRWIDQGIRGFEQLLHVGENIVGIVSDVANAWRLAGGESTGLIQNADQLTTWIRSWTSSQAGQNSMAEQFRRAREWLGQMSDAIKDIWPTLQNIVQTVREWSALFLTVLGWAARLTSWVQDHTGLVTVMVGAYLTIRTVKPIWDTLSNAASAYTNIMMKAAAMNQGWAQNSVSSLAQAQTAMGKTNTAAQTLAKTFGTSSASITTNMAQVGGASGKLAQGPITRLQSAFMGMITPINSTAGQIRSLNGFIPPVSGAMQVMGTQATTAATAVGRSAASGLFGAAAGLAGFLGPMAIAMVATGGIIWAIDKMGEAHRRAAAEAQAQENALKSLKTTLDGFTGAFTAQTAQQTATQLQGFDIPGVGKRNILEDIARTGVATPEQFIGATNPVNQQQRADILGRLDAQTRGSIEQSDVWKRYHETWERNGVDINTMTLAANGDVDAMNKVHAAEKGMFGDDKGREVFDPTGTFKKSQIALGRAAPSVTDTLLSAGTPSASTAAIALRNVSGTYVQGGQQNQAATQAAFGTGTIKPSSAGYYPPGSSVTMNGPDTAIVTSPGPVGPQFVQNFPADVGTVQPLPDGRVQITLTREAFLRDIEKHADGGMIRGVGSGTSDSNMIMASRGEYIIRKAAVDAIGVTNLDRMNSMRFEGGGLVNMPFPLAPPPPLPPPPPGPLPTSAAENWTDLMLPPANRPTVPSGGPLPFLNTPPAAPPPARPAGPPPAPFNTPPPPVTPAPAPYDSTVGTPPGPAPDGTPHLPDAAAGAPGPVVPSQYPALPAPTTQVPFSPNMVTGIPGVTPGQPYGLPAGTDIRQGAAGFPDWVYQIGNTFGVDGSTYAGHQEGSGQNQGIDWWPKGKSDMSGSSYDANDLAKMDRYAEWLGTQPGVEQVIWENPVTHNRIGFANGQRVGPGTNQPQYYANDWKDHTGHVHTRFSSSPGAAGLMPGMPGMVPGMPGYSPYAPTVNGVPGVPGMPGTGSTFADSNMSLSDRIAKRYEDAFKPENLNKFLFGQAENVGQSMMAIGIQFLSGLTGLDLGSVFGPAQQIMQHFAGSGSGSGSDSSSLQAGSPMDNAVTGDFNSFLNGNGQAGAFDPMAGLDLSSLTSGIATNGVTGPGITNQDASGLQQLAQQMLLQAGFPASEWPPFKQIVDHESSWNPSARNASGAFGLGQFLGHENDEYGQMGVYTTDPAKQLSGMIKYIRDRYGSPSQAWAHWQANNSYAAGGPVSGVPARVSRGEYRMSPKAVSHYGVGFMDHVNNGFAFGGLPLPQGVVMPPMPAPPLPRGPQAQPMRPTPGANQNGPIAPPPVPAAPPIPIPVPAGPGPAGAGVPAPAPAPAPPPPSAGAGGVTTPAPVPQGPNMVDPAMAAQQRGFGMVGAAPATNQHLAQGLSGAIKGGFDAAGQAAATAGSIAGGMGMPGAGQGGQLIQSAMQMAGQFANGLANVAASAGVGTIDQIGTQATPSGTPLLPGDAPQSLGPMQSPDALAAGMPVTQGNMPRGGPAIVNNYFGGIHTQNMDEWQRRQQLLERQQEQPLTNAYVH